MDRAPVHRSCILAAVLGLAAAPLGAQPFALPTPNRALLEPDGATNYFAPTPGKTWLSGTFGCVRSEGWQFHEGIDILCVARDRRGEPLDPITATAPGVVAYVNRSPGLSNYGKYIVLRHFIDTLEVYSLYAHLSQIRQELRPGHPIQGGEIIGTMGRTSNTRQSISRDRAHLHFEINFLLTDRYAAWLKKSRPGQRNDHGNWNGQALAGLDPQAILLAQHREGTNFSFLRFTRQQTPLFRVLVLDTHFPWVQRYASLVQPNPAAESQGVAGYEIAFNYAGTPFELLPKAKSDIHATTRFQLISVNPEEYRRHPCRRLVMPKGARWELGPRGLELLELLTGP